MVIHLVSVVEATASLGLGTSLILNFPHYFDRVVGANPANRAKFRIS